jgi:hypothetical protein
LSALALVADCSTRRAAQSLSVGAISSAVGAVKNVY